MAVQAPGALRRFAELFNQGRYWHAHEALEQAWRVGRSRFYQGLIIYASAFVHAQRGNPRGVELQLQKVPAYLEPYRPSYLGVDVQAVLEHAARVLEHVRASGSRDVHTWRQAWIWPHLPVDDAKVRGDEPELTLPSQSAG
ncbi:MAG TPA: DUF309 domain-containing protein [Limnochordales bacterium]